MVSHTKEQLDKLLENISEVKTTIQSNRSLVREVFHPRQYRILALLTSISIFIFSGTFYLLEIIYGDFLMAPVIVRYFLFFGIALSLAVLGFLKFFHLETSVTNLKKSYTLTQFLIEIYSFRIVHVYIPLMSILGVLIVYFSWLGEQRLIVPTISICIGIIHNFIGSITEIRRYLYCGYWFIFSGLVALMVTSISVCFILPGTIGIGTLLYSLPCREEEV